MKIKNISCTQFAGVRDRNITFNDGINVVFGKNESGKSTLVDLISRTLFQDARIDGRSDKEFLELYFPCKRRGSAITGDFADGKITFEDETGTYTLSKEWSKEPRCTLSTPDGTLRDQKSISAELKRILVYGEGVYSDMLLSSQRNTDSSLQTLLDASRKTEAKQEISDAVSQAFAESDGISIDAIEQAIEAKISGIAGKHWDSERSRPARKSGRWATGLGDILKAYYALEDAREILDRIAQAQSDVDRTSADFSEKNSALCAAEESFERFSRYAGMLALQNERRKNIDRLDKELKKLRDILAVWPELTSGIERARSLLAEKTGRETLDKYAEAKKLHDETERLRGEYSGVPCPTDDEISRVKSAQRTVTSLENKLCGMNLSAAVKMLGGNSLEVTSVRTGEKLDITGERFALTEAVNIRIPGVMEMQLSPANVDIDEVSAKIAAQQEMIHEIFERYSVNDIAGLEQLAKKIAAARTAAESTEMRLAALLGKTDYAGLESAAGDISGEPRPLEEIEAEIRTVCGTSDAARFITARETTISAYAAEYGSISGLKAKAFDIATEFDKAKEAAESVSDIPEEYLGITDPESHLAALQGGAQAAKALREEALTARTAAVSRLQSLTEDNSGDPAAAAEEAERAFEEQKSLLAHWQHIYEVFTARKEQLHSEPMKDISDSFARYLSVITGGKVSSEFPDSERLNVNIYSDNRLMDHARLSEGTKETVSLAFRLAVLDHLFPEGGGVIVLDDPFTEMDAERAAQSCELLKACATRHQVIFLTCHEKYIGMLNAEPIRV